MLAQFAEEEKWMRSEKKDPDRERLKTWVSWQATRSKEPARWKERCAKTFGFDSVDSFDVFAEYDDIHVRERLCDLRRKTIDSEEYRAGVQRAEEAKAEWDNDESGQQRLQQLEKKKKLKKEEKTELSKLRKKQRAEEKERKNNAAMGNVPA